MSSDSVDVMEATCACLACSGGGKRLADFYDRGWIVGHYDDKATFDSDEYAQRGASQLGSMRECAESPDSYLCSLRIAKKIDIPENATTQGEKITAEQRKIGIIKPNTTPLYAFVNLDGVYETFQAGEENEATKAFEGSGADYLYKIVPLSDTRIVEGDSYRLNEYETPNTFSPWGSFSSQVRALYQGEDLPKMSATSYTSDQTELLCAEYIRIIHPEFYPLMRTGGITGTNEGFDILGAEAGTTVIGEVKNRSGIDSDVINTLRRYAEKGAEAYYFVRGGGSDKNVNIVDIQTVLEELSVTYRVEMLEEFTSDNTRST